MSDESNEIMSGSDLMRHLYRCLYQGAEGWNNWRKEHPDVRLDFSGQRFEGSLAANLFDLDFSGAKFSGAYFRTANLRQTDFSNSDLWDAHLSGADLYDANFSGANLIRARLAGTKVAILSGADLSGADLSHSEITGDLAAVNLSGAICNGAKFSGANLSQANVSVAIFDNTIFDKVSFVNANLMGTNFSYAKFVDVDFTGATIGKAVFANNDLSEIKGLDTLDHRMPSTIGIDTLYKSAGRIPATFLRGCGVPDDFITFIPSHFGIQQAIQFYSSFISYASKNEEFARRLYSRMRDEKLRVWFAPEDVKGGEKLYEQIERAIQIHDWLLIVLSDNSLRSRWVMTEIRRARKVELREGRRKLFPIRLVDFDALQSWECFDADTGEDLAVEVRQYFIPDFSNWKDHDAFERSFDRLLRDLRAEENKA
jgi:uncharacterized protein YjbI with pentapeptide repeats